MRTLSLQKALGYAAGAIAVLSFLFTVLWKVFTLTTSVEQQVAINAETNRRLAAIEAAAVAKDVTINSLTADARGLGTRAQDTDRRLNALEDKQSDGLVALAKLQRDLNEVETQFCSADNIRNVTEAAHMRLMAAVWEKVFGAPYQIGNAFYPKVCNRQTN